MIFYVCKVFNYGSGGSGSQVASWATAQTPDYDGVITGLSDIKIGLGDSLTVPSSGIEMKVLRTTATDALLTSLSTAFGLQYQMFIYVDGALYPVGVFYHSSELPVSDAQTTTLYLQDVASRLGTTEIAPSLSEIIHAGTFTTNPIAGNLEDFGYLRGSENTPVRIGFGTDLWNLGTPIWRKINFSAPMPPALNPLLAYAHFISHAAVSIQAVTASNLYAFDGGLEVLPRLPTIGDPSGSTPSFVVTTVPVTKGARTWYVQIVSIPYIAPWVGSNDANPAPRRDANGNITIVSTPDIPIPSPANISGKYTDDGYQGDFPLSAIADIIACLPMAMRWNHVSEIVPGDAAFAIIELLANCDTPVGVDVPSLLTAQAYARPIAGVASGQAREAITQISTASGVNVCASREGLIQFVIPTNATPTTLTRFNDVAFSWRDTGGRGAAICGVQLISQKVTATTTVKESGITYIQSSVMYAAGIRNAILEIDCTMVPLAFQGTVESVLSYMGAQPNGIRLVTLKVPVQDALTMRPGDNITFPWLKFIGASPETITASVESLTFSQDGSVTISAAFNGLDAAPYILPGERLQSIMPALQYSLTGVTSDPDFQSGSKYWEYAGTYWRTHLLALGSDLGTLDVWIRYNSSETSIIYAPGVLSFDPTDGVIITRGPDALESATQTLRGLDNYDILASQQSARAFIETIGAPVQLATSKSYGAVNNAPICNDVGIDPNVLGDLVWIFTAPDTIRAGTGVTGFSTRAGYAAVVDGVGFEVNTVLATGGYVYIFFNEKPTWRTAITGFKGLQFAPISPIGLDTGALTLADGSGSPNGPRDLG